MEIALLKGKWVRVFAHFLTQPTALVLPHQGLLLKTWLAIPAGLVSSRIDLRTVDPKVTSGVRTVHALTRQCLERMMIYIPCQRLSLPNTRL